MWKRTAPLSRNTENPQLTSMSQWLIDSFKALTDSSVCTPGPLTPQSLTYRDNGKILPAMLPLALCLEQDLQSLFALSTVSLTLTPTGEQGENVHILKINWLLETWGRLNRKCIWLCISEEYESGWNCGTSSWGMLFCFAGSWSPCLG